MNPLLGTRLSTGPRLLVSVRDAHEARLARLAGVDWIDLKDPTAGSLGAADAVVAASVAEELRDFADFANSDNCVVSAAVGELRDAPLAIARQLGRHFSLLKVGLSGLRGSPQWPQQFVDFAHVLHGIGASLVPVIYADHELCSAPTPAQVIEVASQQFASQLVWADRPANSRSSSQYLLIDTYTKDGRRLLDWMGVPELGAIIEQAAAGGRQVVVAGSLALQDLPKLLGLPIAAIAVRGAVCAADRRSGISTQKLQQWVELFRNR